MSFTLVRPARPRLNRSELTVPGINAKLFPKALGSEADIVVLDLEDSVAPDDKPKARGQVIEALQGLDWSGKTVSVRINGLDTPYMYRDVIEVVEQAGQHLDLIMVPKVGTASDVYALDMLLTQIQEAKGHETPIGLELIIETALGMANIDAIAAASARNESLHFGVADYAASTRARTVRVGAFMPEYAVLADADEGGERAVHYPDQWHYAVSRMVVAARAHGLRPIDGPFGDYQDDAAYLAAARRSAALGCEGKWAIHPRQIPLANQVYSPSQEEIARAKRILEAMAQALERGQGAVALDGRMIDIASIRQAEALVRQAEAIAER